MDQPQQQQQQKQQQQQPQIPFDPNIPNIEEAKKISRDTILSQINQAIKNQIEAGVQYIVLRVHVSDEVKKALTEKGYSVVTLKYIDVVEW